jgi:assimilatory nitrate reductase catalytic subunit
MGTSVRTTCPYCGVGCGLLTTVDEAGNVAVRGDPEHPANRGRLCSKGSALGDTLGLEGRLLYPEIDGRRVGWDMALVHVAEGFTRIVEAHGPEAVAFYVSGQLLTEDYYVANKLMKGFIGSANIDTNSRLCMASSVAGHRRGLGADAVPGCYDDLELAELVVFAGSNAAWCHPVLYRRIAAAKSAHPGRTAVVIDPRRTATCDIADLHLALAPGTDVVLWNGLLHFLRQHGALDFTFLEAHVQGFGAALAAAAESAPSVPAVACRCGLAEEDVARFYQLFLRTERAVTLYSQGVNQSYCGTDKVNAILNCHLATGRIGRPGMGPFSLTGQPNAMGGREVGALANQLAAHMGFDDAGRVARFWGAPRIATRPGLKAVELFEAIGQGRVRAVWIMATNPAVSLPDAGRVREALGRCELVVVSDCVRDTDTMSLAHVRLPALAWGEKDGTVTNSERRISRQRAFLPPPGEARPDWWIVAEVAKRMGHAAAFDYPGPGAVFAEHVALSGFENEGRRAFDLSGLAALDARGYDALTPIQWPLTSTVPAGLPRLFSDGRFVTPNGRAQLLALTPKPPAHAPDEPYPLALNTGRTRDQWHTMTRTGRSARLAAHAPEPTVELHPSDASRYGVAEGVLVEVASRWGSAVLRTRISEAQRPGSVFVPIHWSGPFASQAVVGAAVNPATDPHSGQPESKHTPVRIRPWRAAWYGFAVARDPLDVRCADYWATARIPNGWRYELAGVGVPASWPAWAARLVGAGEPLQAIEYLDAAALCYRVAFWRSEHLEACVFVGPQPPLASREWIAGLFAHPTLGSAERSALLSGLPPEGRSEGGRQVCACFGVGEQSIRTAVARERLVTVEEIGRHLGAGTGCGSCIPELHTLLTQCVQASPPPCEVREERTASG